MTFTDAIKTCYANYFNISGRARRAEYWWFVLFTAMVMALLAMGVIITLVALAPTGPSDAAISLGSYVVVGVYLIAFVVPITTAQVRRLHDIGRSGWWVALATALPILAGNGWTAFAGVTPSVPGDFSLLATIANLTSLAFLFMLLLPSQRQANKYGPVPA